MKGRPKNGTQQELSQPGIYKIVNSMGLHKYIGQAVSIHARWVQHKRELRLNAHHNPHLQHAWNKYGENNFHFRVIEFCKMRDLNKREQYWIAELKPEYNIVTIISEWHHDKTQAKFYDDEDRDVRRPEWHKWVYGGHRKTST